MDTPDRATKRILVVEDEPSIGNMCRRVLTREGHEVDNAINGMVAQDMMEEKQYDLFLIDIRMPKMNGKELYQWLQKKYPRLSDRVIFTTSSVIGEDTMTFVKQSGRPFLPKPFNSKELTNIVNEALTALGR